MKLDTIHLSSQRKEINMVHFVGAGSGAADLITVRGKKLLEEADVIIYAGSLVNPQLWNIKKKNAKFTIVHI